MVLFHLYCGRHCCRDARFFLCYYPVDDNVSVKFFIVYVRTMVHNLSIKKLFILQLFNSQQC